MPLHSQDFQVVPNPAPASDSRSSPPPALRIACPSGRSNNRAGPIASRRATAFPSLGPTPHHPTLTITLHCPAGLKRTALCGIRCLQLLPDCGIHMDSASTFPGRASSPAARRRDRATRVPDPAGTHGEQRRLTTGIASTPTSLRHRSSNNRPLRTQASQLKFGATYPLQADHRGPSFRASCRPRSPTKLKSSLAGSPMT